MAVFRGKALTRFPLCLLGDSEHHLRGLSRMAASLKKFRAVITPRVDRQSTIWKHRRYFNIFTGMPHATGMYEICKERSGGVAASNVSDTS